MNAPIAFFAYKRPYHTYRALKSLSQNKEALSTDIHVFIDGHTKNSEIHLIDKTHEFSTRKHNIAVPSDNYLCQLRLIQ